MKLAHMLAYGRGKRSRVRVLLLAALLPLGYIGAYVILRASHVFVHYESMEWNDIGPSETRSRPGLILFKPMMCGETLLWQHFHRTAG